METSIFDFTAAGGHEVMALLAWASVLCAAGAAAILIWYLFTHPPLGLRTRVLLLVGIAVLPIAAAMSGNIVGFEVSKQRAFCNSCHVMTPYTADATDPKSESLASIHTRNHWFGGASCYTCHSDYGMFGTVLTKISGMKHLTEYYTRYKNTPIPEALATIELYKPFSNTACLECHSTQIPSFAEQEDHRAALDELRTQAIGCASEGCHGPAHPFSKPKKQKPDQPVAEVTR